MSEVKVKKVRFADDIPDSDHGNKADAIEIAAVSDTPVNAENDIAIKATPTAADEGLPTEANPVAASQVAASQVAASQVAARRYCPMMWKYLTTRISKQHCCELVCVGSFVACLLIGVTRFVVLKLEEILTKAGDAANSTEIPDTL